MTIIMTIRGVFPKSKIRIVIYTSGTNHKWKYYYKQGIIQ
ncbi:hypothetical protein TALC_01275 [Thermoplasmatales archaeon BRNA1]|nr:hypothetical protein TALC_01275 [Thermoplasmatales archaeon BRNA1]